MTCIHELTAGCLDCADRAAAVKRVGHARAEAARLRLARAAKAERRAQSLRLALEARQRREARQAAKDEADTAALLKEIEASVADQAPDYPHVHEDDLHHEIARNRTETERPAVRDEVRRRLGFCLADF